jgi:hypothetical protein
MLLTDKIILVRRAPISGALGPSVVLLWVCVSLLGYLLLVCQHSHSEAALEMCRRNVSKENSFVVFTGGSGLPQA